MPTTIVSSPGKVLLAGGYLVLDPKYSGLVVSTSARFYTVVRQPRASSCQIHVRSPQFRDAVWVYTVKLGTDVEVNQAGEVTSKNKFVHIALQKTLQLVCEIKGTAHLKDALEKGLDVTIVGDNDFYSQRTKLAELGLTPTMSSLSMIEPFVHTGVGLAEVHKTGLGSSAALITSLVASLLLHFSAISPSSLESEQNEGRVLVHNTAQFIHCLAQGKVGSGFDVSSAVFGSQLYTRFNPSIIQNLMADNPSNEPLLPVLSPSNKAWDNRVSPFKLPPLTRLMLADVDAGSDTPSLVGQVLKWRRSQGVEADAFWDLLAESNSSLGNALTRLSELHAEDATAYAAVVNYLSTLQPVQWLANPSTSPADERFLQAFHDAHRISQDIRAKMREMGERSGVPIEPQEQTELLDACVKQAGVVGGGVPGAGGYDAIWLLVLDPPVSSPEDRPLGRVEQVWLSWKNLDVSPLSASESLEKGLRLERVDDIPGLGQMLAE